MKYIALICARGGSKSLPGKNIKPLNGVPLIGWSIKVAKQVERISRVIVSTDSEEIAKIALEYGAEVPFMRPNELAQDDSPEWLVWKHALDYLKNQNNEIGVPLTVLSAEHDTEIMIVEMGMRKKGDIRFLTQIVQPTHVVITGIGLTHVAQFSSPRQIATAKAEIFNKAPKWLTKTRQAFINFSSPYRDVLVN